MGEKGLDKQNLACVYNRNFVVVDLDNIVEHLNDLFRIVHATNFKTSVRALQLLFRLSEQR